MKIVIDTSVWISALITKRSAARDLLRLALSDKVYPQMSEALFYEYESVMKRKKIQTSTPLTIKEQERLFYAYLSSCRWNEIYYMWRPNLKDGNDDFLVELAVASGAEYIVTYNVKDFNNAELAFTHKIVTPEQLIEELK